MICLISFRKFSGLLSPSTSVSAIGSLGTICLELDILRFEWTERPQLDELYRKDLVNYLLILLEIFYF